MRLARVRRKFPALHNGRIKLGVAGASKLELGLQLLGDDSPGRRINTKIPAINPGCPGERFTLPRPLLKRRCQNFAAYLPIGHATPDAANKLARARDHGVHAKRPLKGARLTSFSWARCVFNLIKIG